jgi:hypothetical protein
MHSSTGPTRLSTGASSILATTPAEKLWPATAAVRSRARAGSGNSVSR